jgi:hypothetical protein
MCIISAPYLHKMANWALNMLLFYALGLMLMLTKSVQNSNLEGAVSAYFL